MNDDHLGNGKHRVPFMNLAFDNVSIDDVLSVVDATIESDSYGYMTSLNVDMVAKSTEDSLLREALLGADLLLMDSAPLMRLANQRGLNVVQKISGSDLMPIICNHAAKKGYSCFFLGGAEGVPERAAANLTKENPDLVVAGALSPEFGFEKDTDSIVEIAETVRQSAADLLFVCMGAPKSELLAAHLFEATGVHFAFCIGAAIDFAAGNASRAPIWMQESGFEWLYRFSQEPKRLFKRYFIDSWKVAPYLLEVNTELPVSGKAAYAYKALNGYYWWLDKLNKSKFIEDYPKYLRKLGVEISESPGDCWISPTVFLDSAGYDYISIGNNCTISFDVAILVHDYSINNALRAIGVPDAEKHRMIKRHVSIGD
ncbi:MAG: WecB/TagA/CpsF family glycosyltransferase, partial [Eggerthellaceae bacterium]|nr:WecB/TagA/CpsF family glycosyltransferase [Eggerthellaceae bacterium]